MLYQSAGTTGNSSRVTRGGTYFLWDLHTGLQTPLPMLTKCVHAFRQREEEDLCPSPDGQWIYMLAGHHLLMLCRLDGTAYREWDNAEGARWLPDSRHLAVGRWDGTEGTLLRSVDASQADVPLKVTPPGHVLPNGEAVNLYWDTSDPQTVHVAFYGKGPTFPKKWQKNVIWPIQSHLEGLAYSPQVDRIACLLFVTYTPSWQRWAHRILPQIPLHSDARYEVWVCRLDGTQRQLLGILPSKSGVEEAEEVKQFEWPPGGKRLSFVHNKTLFTVPAP